MDSIEINIECIKNSVKDICIHIRRSIMAIKEAEKNCDNNYISATECVEAKEIYTNDLFEWTGRLETLLSLIESGTEYKVGKKFNSDDTVKSVHIVKGQNDIVLFDQNDIEDIVLFDKIAEQFEAETEEYLEREDILQTISDQLSPEAVEKIASKNYSNDVLEYISDHAPTATAEVFASTKYQSETVEKLLALYHNGKIDSYDLRELMEESTMHNRNEKYTDIFADLVCVENYRDTYAVFRTTNVADVSFEDMYLGIRQGMYEANDIGMVQMNQELAREMYNMGINLVVCEEYDYYSDLLDFESAYTDDSFVAVQRHELASAINDMFRQPDWAAFKEYLRNKITDMNKLTPYILKQQYVEFQNSITD